MYRKNLCNCQEDVLVRVTKPEIGRNDCCELQLARAYVKYQKIDQYYNPMESLSKGTVFPELYKPYNRKVFR